MKKLIWTSILVLSFEWTGAQNLIPYRYNELWGYADESGKVIIQPAYKSARFFRKDGLAEVTRDTVLILIDKTGKEILPGKYQAIFEFSNGLAAVCSGGKMHWLQGEIIGGKWGYINENFEEVIPCQYSRAQSFVGDYAIVQQEDNWGSWGLINKSGKIILPFKYTTYSFDMRPFPGLIWGPQSGTLQKDVTGKGEVWQVINLKGQPIGSRFNAMHGKLAFYEKPSKHDDLYGTPYPQKTGPIKLKDTSGKIITLNRKDVSIEYNLNNQFLAGIAANSPPDDAHPDLKKYALINQKGEIIVDFGQYEYLKPAYNGRIAVLNKGLYGFIDLTGKELVAPKYDYVENFDNGYAHVYYNYSSSRNKVDGYINPEGKEFFYDDPTINVVHHMNTLLFDEHNTLLKPSWIAEDDNLIISGNKIKVSDGNGTYKATVNLTGSKIYEYSDWESYCCRLFENSVLTNSVDTIASRIKRLEAQPGPGGSWVDAPFSDTLMLANFSEKIGVVDMTGKTIVPSWYKTVELVSGTVSDKEQAAFLAKTDSTMVVYNLNGRIVIPSYYQITQIMTADDKSVFNLTDVNSNGIADAYGKILLPIQYGSIEAFDGTAGLSSYQRIMGNGEQVGVLRNYSQIIVPPSCYDLTLINWRNQNLFLLYHGKYEEVVDSLGRVVLPKEFANGDSSPVDLDIPGNNPPMYFILYKKKKYGVYQGGKGLIVPISKSNLDIYAAFGKAYFIFSEKNKSGLMDGDGKVILPAIYPSIDFIGSEDVVATMFDDSSVQFNFTRDHKVVKLAEQQ